MSEYDPTDDMLTLLKGAFEGEEGRTVFIGREWELKNLDLNQMDYILIRDAYEEDEYLGIGGMEFVRNITVELIIKTNLGRERVRELGEKLRRYLRGKENWMVGERLLLNLQVRSGDLSRDERGIWSLVIVVEWFQIEVRV
ncbi:MAG: hypothetical protein QXF58_04250 [Desulfurococcaceae archaeon]